MDELIGQKVKRFRKLTKKEIEAEGWDSPTSCIEFENGTIIFASQDSEGNGPGRLFGRSGDHSFYVG